MKRDTRNYGKFHPRFVVGGPVPTPEEAERQVGERATEESLWGARAEDIDRYGNPKENELERNRSKSVIQAPLKEDPQDVEDEYGGDRGA
jgi:hypothetical protein